MAKQQKETWRQYVDDCLSTLHPAQIEEGILKPAINQLIEDYQDSLDKYILGEEEQAALTKQIIKNLKNAYKILFVNK